MKPSVGRIVHYQRRPDGPCEAAIVTSTGLGLLEFATHSPAIPDPVSLTVFPGSVNIAPVGYDEAKGGGTWHWPERED